MDLTIKELLLEQETYEKDQARYKVKSSTKYRISDVEIAAEKIVEPERLKEQLREVIISGVRAITIKYSVEEARASKQKMEDEIETQIIGDLRKYGLELINFQLVDFQDVIGKDGEKVSSIISDISRRREVEIETETRERNAEKEKQALMKEAEADEKAKEREIARDKVVGEREQAKLQAISEKEKLAKEKEYEVIKVATIKQAEIDKQKAIIVAEQNKATQAIKKEQDKLEGEGYRALEEEKAKGNAAEIREKGFAEAEAKDKLQEALNKFKPAAIQALVAEKVVEAQKEVGIAGAKALEKSEMKVFAGGDGEGKQGFDIGKVIEASSVSSESTAKAILNKLARPNDWGFSPLDIKENGKDKMTRKPNEKPKIVTKASIGLKGDYIKNKN